MSPRFNILCAVRYYTATKLCYYVHCVLKNAPQYCNDNFVKS